MSKSVINLLAFAIIVAMSSCEKRVTETVRIPLVRTETVVSKEETESCEYPGIIKPQDDLAIAFKVNGQLTSVLDKPGMEVRKGDLLAALDDHDYQVSLDAAQASYKQSEKEFDRVKQLYASKTISPNDFEKAEMAHRVICSKYQAAKDALGYTEVLAPFDGYVQNVYRQRGEIVQAGMPVVSFISKSSLKVEVFLSFKDYERMDRLSEMELVLDDKRIGLKLGSVSRQANAAQLYKAEFHIQPEEYDDKIVAGKNCRVRLAFSSTNDNTLRVPLSAIMNIDNETSVWVLTNQNSVTKRTIKIQGVDHDMAIVSGLKAGQQIVTSGIHVIKEGETVEVIPAPSETNIGGQL